MPDFTVAASTDALAPMDADRSATDLLLPAGQQAASTVVLNFMAATRFMVAAASTVEAASMAEAGAGKFHT
jgi:hypothetical protein